MQCSDDEVAMLERNGSLNEQLREIDEELEKITESIVDDDIEELPMVTGNASTIVLPSIITTCSVDDVKPLITSMRVTRIGAVSPAAALQEMPKNPLKESPTSLKNIPHESTNVPQSTTIASSKMIIDNNDIISELITKNGHSSSEEYTPEHDDDEDNIYDETPELSDLNDCLRITQPIWHLPHVDRATVVHYLQTKPVGVFIVSHPPCCCFCRLLRHCLL